MDERDFVPLLGLPVPESLPMALGYRGPGRFIGLYWSVEDDELRLTDGRMILEGHGEAWWRYVRHPRVARYLQRFKLGNGDVEATFALLLDIESGRGWIAPREKMEQFVRENAMNESGALLSEIFAPADIARIAAEGPNPDDMQAIKQHLMPEPVTDEDIERQFRFMLQATRDMLRELAQPRR